MAVAEKEGGGTTTEDGEREDGEKEGGRAIREVLQ